MYLILRIFFYFFELLPNISARGCKPTAPPPTPKPKPKRRCPYGYTYICPSFKDGSCLPKFISVCFKAGKEPSKGKARAPTKGKGKGEMAVEMRMPAFPVEMRMPGKMAKPTKEEREEVIGKVSPHHFLILK